MDMRVAAEASGSEDQPWTLPNGWCWVTASEIADIVGGGTPRNAADPTNFDPDGIPWITPADLSGYHKATIERGQRCLSQTGFRNSSAQLLPEGSLLISSRAPVGYCVVAAHPVCTNQGFKSLRLRVPADPFFLRYYVLLARQTLNDAASGTTFKELSGAAMGGITFPLAPLAEQRRIVERIESLFAEIGEGEAALAEARKGLETFRRALLKSAVTGELTRDWRENNQPNETGHDLLARIKAERDATPKSGRGKKAAASPPLDTSDLPELPEGWAWARLGQLLSHLTSGSRDWAEYYDKGSKVFVMAQNVRPGRFNHAYTKHVDPPDHLKDVKRSRIQRDDLLITIVGANTGDVCRVNFEATDFFVCQSVALMRPALAELSQYLEMYLIAPDGGRRDMEKVIYGAGRPHLSFDQIEALPIPIPPPAEMLEILGRTSGLLSAYSDTLLMLEAETADAARLRQAVLKAAFEGKLVPQDPADEPASGLLSRLEAQESANLKQTKRRKKV